MLVFVLITTIHANTKTKRPSRYMIRAFPQNAQRHGCYSFAAEVCDPKLVSHVFQLAV